MESGGSASMAQGAGGQRAAAVGGAEGAQCFLSITSSLALANFAAEFAKDQVPPCLWFRYKGFALEGVCRMCVGVFLPPFPRSLSVHPPLYVRISMTPWHRSQGRQRAKRPGSRPGPSRASSKRACSTISRCAFFLCLRPHASAKLYCSSADLSVCSSHSLLASCLLASPQRQGLAGISALMHTGIASLTNRQRDQATS